jgi:hypothetical protein
MKIHNFCIDEKISLQLRYRPDGTAEIQPNRWAVSPYFDENAIPVNHLSVPTGNGVTAAPVHSRRNLLKMAIDNAGLVRPPASQQRRNARQRRS